MRKFRLSLALASAFTLSACGSTEALLAGVGVAGGIISSLTESPDYKIYAKQCASIIASAEKAAAQEAGVLTAIAQQENMGGQVLLYMALKPKTTAFQQCALALPKSFLTSLAESGNVLNFVATIYGINRDSGNASRQLQVSKELGLAQLQSMKEMKELETALISTLAGQTSGIANKLADTKGE